MGNLKEREPAYWVIFDKVDDLVRNLTNPNEVNDLDGSAMDLMRDLVKIATLMEVLCEIDIPRDELESIVKELEILSVICDGRLGLNGLIKGPYETLLKRL